MAKKVSGKKIVKKEKVVKETKKETITDEIKEESKKILTPKVTAILYFICGGCWLVSAILYIVAKQVPIFDFVLAVIFIGIGILYLIKDKKNKKNK